MGLILKNSKELLQKMWSFKKIYFLYVLLYAISTGTLAYGLIETPKVVLNMVTQDQIVYTNLAWLFGGLLLSGLVNAYAKYKYTPIGYELRYMLLLDITKLDLEVSYEDYMDPNVQNNLRAFKDPLTSIMGVQGFFLSFGILCGNISVLTITSSIMWSIHFSLGLLTITYFILKVLFVTHANRQVFEKWRKGMVHVRKYHYLSRLTMDVSSGKEIRIHQMQQKMLGKFTDALKKIQEVNLFGAIVGVLRNERLKTVYEVIRDFWLYFFIAVLYINGEITLALVSSYIAMTLQFDNNIRTLDRQVDIITDAPERMRLMLDRLQTKVEVDVGETLHELADYTITFEHVSFRYPNAKNFIYEDLNFTIHKGEKIAIVGLNGVGKTTMMRLLMRLYRPTEGVIRINGVDIQSYSKSSYMKLFAPVLQDMTLYSATSIDNIAFHQEHDEEKAIQYLKQVDLYDKLAKHPDFLHKEMSKYVDENGIELSGGELQRLCLARAFYTERSVLVLDEPTSAMDALKEAEFYRSLKDMDTHDTILFISHRLASTSFCDKIILIQDKGIAEQGTHAELMQLDGVYRKLYDTQAKYYQEEVELV